MASRAQKASHLRKALQLVVDTFTDTQALVVPTLFEPYKANTTYETNEIFSYGVNGVGDPQLYRVVQAHTSQEDWKPDSTPSLYTKLGLDDAGYPIWSQPTGAHDAYNKGDIVNYNGVLYKSLVDGNVWIPEEGTLWTKVV